MEPQQEMTPAILEACSATKQVDEEYPFNNFSRGSPSGIWLFNDVIVGNRADFALTVLVDLEIAKIFTAIQKEFSSCCSYIKEECVGTLWVNKLETCKLTAGSDVDLIYFMSMVRIRKYLTGISPLYSPILYVNINAEIFARRVRVTVKKKNKQCIIKVLVSHKYRFYRFFRLCVKFSLF